MIAIPKNAGLPPHRRQIWIDPGDTCPDLVPIEDAEAVCETCGAPANPIPDSFAEDYEDRLGWVHGYVGVRCTADARHVHYSQLRAVVEGIVLVSRTVRQNAIAEAVKSRTESYGSATLYRTWNDPRARIADRHHPLPEDALALVTLRDGEEPSEPMENAIDTLVRHLTGPNAGSCDPVTLGQIVWEEICQSIGVNDPVEPNWTIIEEGGRFGHADDPRDPSVGMTEADEYDRWVRFLDPPMDAGTAQDAKRNE